MWQESRWGSEVEEQHQLHRKRRATTTSRRKGAWAAGQQAAGSRKGAWTLTLHAAQHSARTLPSPPTHLLAVRVLAPLPLPHQLGQLGKA